MLFSQIIHAQVSCVGTVVKMGRGMSDLDRHNKAVCRGWAIAKSRTRVSEIKSISQYCKSPLSETT